MSGNEEGKRGIGPQEFVLDEQGKDIKVESKRKLSDYLSRRTRGGSETFTPPVQGGGDYTYMPPRPNAYPVESRYNETAADASVKLQGDFAESEDLERLVGDPVLRAAVSLQPSARENIGAPTGNTVNVDPATREVVQATVLSRNRFTSEDKFTSKSYRNAVPRKPTGRKPQEGDGSVFEEMRQRAIETMLKAAGGSAGPGSSVEGLNDAGDLKITTERIGFKAPSLLLPFLGIDEGESKIASINDLRVGADRQKFIAPSGGLEGLDNPSPADITEGRFADDQLGNLSDTQPTQYNNRSFGQLNSFLQQFSGKGTFPSASGLALLAYGALFVGVSLISLIISVVVNRLPRPDSQTSVLPLGAERGAAFGKFLFDGDSGSGFLDVLRNLGGLVAKTLGLMQPYESPFDSVAGDFFAYFFSALEGALSITGINVDNDVTLGSFVGATANIAINFGTAPGYYLVLIREIARDLYYMTQTFSSKAESSILGILDAIRSMKLVRFVDTCARLGIVNSFSKNIDAVSDPDVALDGITVAGASIPTPANLTKNYFQTAQARVSRSREVEGSKRLAWSHISLGYTRTELVTAQSLRAFANYSVNENKETGATALRRLRARKVFADSGRISPEVREQHERLLDAEYMPFYFHDVRTNEILSFHAFLSALSDSFTANYTATDGFGRMDPIQTYKNTTRSISFTFTAVATSPEDHENMWYSINKLVNMLYPQWSQGEAVTDGGNNKFTQPFSQTVAASPMIRVRIGDVIHSNYSRFGLGRIFGLDEADAKIEGTSLENPSKGIDSDINDIAIGTEGGISTIPTVSTLASNSNDLNSSTSVAVDNDIISTVAGTIVRTITPLDCEVRAGKYKLYQSEDGAFTRSGGSKEKLEKNIAGKIIGYSLKERVIGEPKSFIVVKLNEILDISRRGGSTSYEFLNCTEEDLITYPGVNYANTLSSFLPTTPTAEDSRTVISKFLDPASNPIVKSFEQGSGGRGLAGFISQLGVEYGNTETPWTVERGSRAPNMVTLSVTFLPIHDIPMGLAADGTARAVAYPVGGLTRLRFMPDSVERDRNDTNGLPFEGKKR